ncbi:tyrosine-type recombinase/integrase [Elstera cyanobacteriorum]|uniref:tyrosine-type recombinase/integrase n=1 Tax=Elstera cyanobacteriorum TaxID=2022747 RepID=UPI00235756AF|nr:site-specific integrase [Elstera cyanobacteriorum]
MPKFAKGLSAKQVQTIRESGMYADGNGLYLNVKPTGARSWIFRYTINGRRREMGIGPYPLLSLAEAREKAFELKKDVTLRKIDPLDDRRTATAASVTFEKCAIDYITAMSPQWSNPKHAAQWASTLSKYAFPVIGSMATSEIDTAAVLRVIEPLWRDKTETASRLRGRLETILDVAKVKGYRTGDNPARWGGNLELLLPARGVVAPVEHHAALTYADVPAFWQQLKDQNGTGARALEFLILTAARSGEVIGARWDEIDLEAGTWTIPTERMKARVEHVVPLSPAAISLLQSLPRIGEFCFPGRGRGSSISNMTMTQQIRRMGFEVTAHGFRSSFRTWAAEKTDFPHEVCEAALAHTVADKVVAAYQRGTFFEKRRALMEQWAGYVAA